MSSSARKCDTSLSPTLSKPVFVRAWTSRLRHRVAVMSGLRHGKTTPTQSWTAGSGLIPNETLS